MFSGELVRFPKLKLAYSEGQIGWIPYALERADNVWEHHDELAALEGTIPEPPSTYYYGPDLRLLHADVHGLVEHRGVGEDNICFETDYPHTDTTWPYAKEYVEKMTLADRRRSVYKVLRGNAIKMLELDRT